MIRVLHICKSDLFGGASRAAYRIHNCLDKVDGIESRMLVLDKVSGDWTVQRAAGYKGVILRLVWSKLCDLLNRRAIKSDYQGMFDQHKLSYPPLLKEIRETNADIIHLHFISNEMLSIEDLGKIKKPIVWTLHDMCPFSGGWHYQGDPNLQEQEQNLQCLSNKVIKRKLKAWSDLNLKVVCPSKWLRDEAQQSQVFQSRHVEHIPYALSSQSFYAHERTLARKALGLPVEGKYIAFAAMSATSDARKGFGHLQEALQAARALPDHEISTWHLLIFGADQPEEAENLGLPVSYLGTLQDEASLALAYSAADVFVAPSRQDNLPLTVHESHMCGTPVVAFDIGGMPDMITTHQTGFLAPPYDAQQLLAGIQWVLSHPDTQSLRELCRETAKDLYAEPKIARQYHAIYLSLHNSNISS